MASLFLCVLLLIRLVFFRGQMQKPLAQLTMYLSMAILALNLLNLYFSHEIILKLYPVVMSAGVFVAFAHSLVQGHPIIVQFAMVFEKELSEQKLKYIRKLTFVWAGWLLVNTVISLYTVLWSDIATWSFYNGVLFYLISGLLFAADILYRRRKRYV
jgi:uncharacterized membrane protein